MRWKACLFCETETTLAYAVGCPECEARYRRVEREIQYSNAVKRAQERIEKAVDEAWEGNRGE